MRCVSVVGQIRYTFRIHLRSNIAYCRLRVYVGTHLDVEESDRNIAIQRKVLIHHQVVQLADLASTELREHRPLER